MIHQPIVRLLASFSDGRADLDRVLPSAEADGLMKELAKDSGCTRHEARGLWSSEKRGYDKDLK